MVRAGLTSADQGVGLTGSALEILNAPGRQFHSPVEMSQMAPFTDAAAAIDETNFSNTFISYYTYGAAIATALDLSLRGRSDGKITLDDYMRAMWLAYGKPDGPSPAIVAKPYTLQDARDRLADVSGDRAFANDFFDKYIEGREPPDFATLFARAGLVLRRRNPQAAWVGVLDASAVVPGADVGRRRPLRRHEPVVASPPRARAWGTPAFAAGLEEADVITTVDGRPCRRRRRMAGGHSRAQARRPDGGRTTCARTAKAATMTWQKIPRWRSSRSSRPEPRDAGTEGVSRCVAQVQAKVTIESRPQSKVRCPRGLATGPARLRSPW